MCCRFYKRIFSILIFALMFCSFVTLQSITWAQGTQPAASHAPKADITKFYWLLHLMSDTNLIGDTLASGNTPIGDRELYKLSKNMTPKEKDQLKSFLNTLKATRKVSLLLELLDGYQAICKSKPCPPIAAGELNYWDWLIASIIDSNFQQKLFNPATVDNAIRGLQTNVELGPLKKLVSTSSYQQTIVDVRQIVCSPNLWGPCP